MKINEPKKVRKAAKCYIFKEDEILVTKYKEGNIKAEYYDIPGGKIEEGETAEQTAIREVKEETGIIVKNLKYSGNIIVEYPNRIFNFEIFTSKEFEGKPKDFEENSSQWIKIEKLLNEEKILSNIMILDRFFIKGLLNKDTIFNMYISVDEEENILEIKYKYNEKGIK